MYNRGILSQNTYYVLLRSNISATKAYYFQGDENGTILDSQRDAALKAIRFLCKKYNVEIYGVHLEQAIMYKKCSTFYQDRAIALEDELEEKHLARQVQPPHSLPLKTVELDFFDFLTPLTYRLGIPTGKIDIMPAEPNMFQACIELHYPSSPETPQYILGDTCACATEAQQNVAKKAITQLQSDYKFTVRDVSYVPMVRAWAECSLFQKKCKALEERVAKKQKDRVANLLPQTSGDNWSPGPSGTMGPLRVPPPLPHKKRKLPNDFDVRKDSAASCRIAANVAEAAFPKP